MQPDGPLDVLNDFDAWAVVSARIAGRTEQEVAFLLSELGVAHAWVDAEARWSRVLGRELSLGELEHATRYTVRCASEFERRRAGARKSARPEVTRVAEEQAPHGSHEDTLPPFLRGRD